MRRRPAPTQAPAPAMRFRTRQVPPPQQKMLEHGKRERLAQILGAVQRRGPQRPLALKRM
jgi:hypothetical protein